MPELNLKLSFKSSEFMPYSLVIFNSIIDAGCTLIDKEICGHEGVDLFMPRLPDSFADFPVLSIDII